MASRRPEHLTSKAGRAAFRREYERRGYSPERIDRIYGATEGKVRREQMAADRGRRSRGESYYYVAHPHPSREHGGRCSPACRRGEVAHRHRVGTRPRG